MEGFSLASYAAAITTHIGLVVTVNSTYVDPYNTARSVVTLDHLSRGRAGLNIITGAEGSTGYRNFSVDRHATVDEKYDRANEFIEIVHRLSDSWEDGWLVDDKENGVFLDSSKGHYIDHVGTHFSVKGPLNVPRPPQGHVPVIHAGTSDRSFDFGARHADIRFSPYRGKEWNKTYYSRVTDSLKKYDRDPADQLIIPGIVVYVAETSAEAHRTYREVQSLTLKEFAPKVLENFLGVDIGSAGPHEKFHSVVDVDALREKFIDQDFALGTTGDAWHPSRFTGDKYWALEQALASFDDDEDITLRDIHNYIANFPGNQSPVVGSADEVADWIEENFHERAFDGVKLFPPYSRSPLDAFVDLVVPKLQRKGIFRTEYSTSTLRGHLGLERPENLFATADRP
jgi:N-acetyl-S-(2-succino)cysteine monooxygenase